MNTIGYLHTSACTIVSLLGTAVRFCNNVTFRFDFHTSTVQSSMQKKSMLLTGETEVGKEGQKVYSLGKRGVAFRV